MLGGKYWLLVWVSFGKFSKGAKAYTTTKFARAAQEHRQCRLNIRGSCLYCMMIVNGHTVQKRYKIRDLIFYCVQLCSILVQSWGYVKYENNTLFVQVIALGVPLAFISANYFATRDKSDFIQATLCKPLVQYETSILCVFVYPFIQIPEIRTPLYVPIDVTRYYRIH